MAWCTATAELLSLFIDAFLRGSLKDITDPELEARRATGLCQLFSYLKEKDVFQEFYRTRLAKRLLQTTINQDAERDFLGRLQRSQGKTFTHKMEGMINDLESTRNLSKQYGETTSVKVPEIDCQILTAAHWPAYKSCRMEAPRMLKTCLDSFLRFYRSKYATRKLTWIHMMGTSQFTVAFPKGPKELTGSIYQVAILLLIDEEGPLSPAQLGEKLKLDVAKVVKSNIAPMFLSKQCNVLALRSNTPPTKGISDTEPLAINLDFVSKLRKLKVPQPMNQGAAEGMPTEEGMNELRKVQMDAAIVRIMKSRRTLSTSDLQTLVIEQLTRLFIPQPKPIKQRIDDLIARAYLKRDPSEPAKLEYLA